MSSMRTIVNTGDYLEVLKALIEAEVGKSAEVLYWGEVNPNNKTKPFVFLHMPEVIDINHSGDGRHEETLSVTIQIKVPKNTTDAPIVALNVSGFIRALIVDQLFCDYVSTDDDHFDEPDEIGGQPLEWDTNEQGYEVSFTQVIRYGTADIAAFVLKAIDIKEEFGEPKRIYEFSSDPTTNRES